jgi:prolycopene isomerase
MHKPLENSYCDVAIIGAGIGGLTAAALLSKLGFSVCVLEKEPHVGGYLAGFKRKGFRFDTAIHWLNKCNEKGLVSRLFDVLGKDHPIEIPQIRSKKVLKGFFNQPEKSVIPWINLAGFSDQRKQCHSTKRS